MKIKTLKCVVMLSTYNGGDFFFEYIRSLQSAIEKVNLIADVTLKIRDDGSDYKFLNELQSFEFSNKSWVNVDYGKNIGSKLSYLKLIEDVSIEYDLYFFADQDDVWLPSKIEKVIKVVGLISPVVYASTLNVVDVNLKFLKKSNQPKHMIKQNALIENVLTGCTMALNQKMMIIMKEKIPNKVVMHDAWIYLVGIFFGTIYYDNESNILYRQHQGNVVGYRNDFFSRVIKYLKKNQSEKNESGFYSQVLEFNKLYGNLLNSNDKHLVQNYISNLQASWLKRVAMLLTGNYSSNLGVMITILLYVKILIGYKK